MNIAKAIKNLTAGREDCGMIPEDEYTPTMDLAAEALKRLAFNRLNTIASSDGLLPGETED